MPSHSPEKIQKKKSRPSPAKAQKASSKPKHVVGPWVQRMLDEFRKSNAKAAELPHTSFRGGAHSSPNDDLHVTAVLSEGEGKKGKMTLHVYTDGRVSQSAKDETPFMAEKATEEEMAATSIFSKGTRSVTPVPDSDTQGHSL
ncbi:hypothetical protein E4U34_003139 [Claviceps purpurea]|nr:hypothetical protein E4U34_003139 [Claviceps purpurea]KAG6269270.1 hypothetical protein E4U48_004331 [Claviceps purpurea]